MVEFQYGGQRRSLNPGGHFARPRDAGFRDTPATELEAMVAEIEAGRPWREVVHDHFATPRPWLHAIISDPRRTGFWAVVPGPNDRAGPALDIGAGWGQIARPLAAHRPVVALEPVAERMAFIRAAARQDGVADHLAFIEADYLEVDFVTPFALICAIGVLEWAGAFQSKDDPRARQRAFLRKTRRELADRGCLVLGIENRLGLKYLLGCPDDHLGVPGVACAEAARAIELWHHTAGQELQCFTYSRQELEQMLHEAGYGKVEFFGAFPDYKLPVRVVPLDDGGTALHRFLLNDEIPPEHNGYNGERLGDAFQQQLAARYRHLAEAGTAAEHVPSFFVRASG
jgi:hypothetical protein